MRKFFFALAFLSGIGTGLKAQPGGPSVMSAAEMAEHKTETIAQKTGLSEKQRKKVYKLYLQQAREIERSMSSTGTRPTGSPGEGMRGGGGPQGGMRGGSPGGGMRGGGGMPGGGPGGTRGEGGPGEGSGQRPERAHGQAPKPYEEPEKSILKREKKMKKILTSEQYSQWVVIEKEMEYERFRNNFMKMEQEK